MPVYRITFGFAGGNTGWTETHACFQQVTTPAQVLPSLVPIQQARANMLGAPFVLNGVRISTYSDGGTPPNRLPRQVFLDKTQYAYKGPNIVNNGAEPAVVALQANGFAGINAPAAYQGNENQTFLGAPLDVCVDNAGVVFPANGGLNGAFTNWKAAMLAANMGWLAVTKIGAPIPIQGITQLASGQVEYVTATQTNPPFANGNVYNLRVSGVNGGRSPLNGPQIGTLTTLDTFTTKEQIAFATAQTGGQIQAYSRVLTFVPYFNLVLQLLSVKHKRGRPFLSEPGRARKRIRA